MKYYITRDKNVYPECVSIWIFDKLFGKKPVKKDGIHYEIENDENVDYSKILFEMSIRTFKKMYGFTPPKGSIELIKIDSVVQRKIK